MKTKIENKTNALHIEVNCEQNTKEAIAEGGHEILGYDFYVNTIESFENIKSYIEKEISGNNQPLISILDKGLVEVNEKQIFGKKKIKACIKQGYIV